MPQLVLLMLPLVPQLLPPLEWRPPLFPLHMLKVVEAMVRRDSGRVMQAARQCLHAHPLSPLPPHVQSNRRLVLLLHMCAMHPYLPMVMVVVAVFCWVSHPSFLPLLTVVVGV